MQLGSRSIEAAEDDARKILREKLNEQLELAADALIMAAKALGATAKTPAGRTRLSRVAAMHLLVRLCNDIRATVQLSEAGYPVQAMSIAACAFEAAYALAYIGHDDGKAEQWMNHEREDKSFESVFGTMKGALAEMGVPEEVAKSQYERVYRLLCMAKHSNPLFLQEHGTEISADDDTLYFRNGPMHDESATVTASYSLLAVTNSACLGVRAFAIGHLPVETRDAFVDQGMSIWTRGAELADKVVQESMADELSDNPAGEASRGL